MTRRVLAGLILGSLATACAGSAHPKPPAVPTTATTAPTAETTTSSTDPGSLPQTTARPTSADPAFQARIQALWKAVVAGRPDEALPAFFPLAAYVQVKALRDPAGDWQHRLVSTFDQDVVNVQRSLGDAAATFLGIDVPDPAAVWVRPGAEVNKIGYWRVYGSPVRYEVAGRTRSFPIASLISWRGQWYVVHFAHLSR